MSESRWSGVGVEVGVGVGVGADISGRSRSRLKFINSAAMIKVCSCLSMLEKSDIESPICLSRMHIGIGMPDYP